MSTVTFSYRPEDLVDSWNAQWRDAPQLRLLRIAPYLIIAFNLLPGLYRGLSAGRWGVGLAEGGSVALGLFLIGLYAYHDRVLAPRRAARVLAHQAALQGEMTVSWTVWGAEFRHATGDQRMAWTDFAKWLETPASLVLVRSAAEVNLIPKRCLTPEQLAEIRSFLPPVKKTR